MKIKVIVEKVETSETEVDVEFPVFFRAFDSFDGGGWYDAFYRIDQDGTETKIIEHDSHWEFAKKNLDLRKSLGVMLNDKRGYYERCEEKHFDNAMQKFLGILNQVPRRL